MTLHNPLTQKNTQKTTETVRQHAASKRTLKNIMDRRKKEIEKLFVSFIRRHTHQKKTRHSSSFFFFFINFS